VGAEVDEDVGALGGREEDALDGGGGGEEALVGADEVEGDEIADGETEEAGVGAVHDAEAIEARLDVEVGEELAVGEDGVAVDLRDPGGLGVGGDGVVELAVGEEGSIAEEERDLVWAGGQVEGGFGLVADEEETLETGVDVEPVNAHGVVVVEEQGRFLLVGVMVEEGFAGDDPVLGVAVALRRSAAAVDMDDAADLGLAALGAVEVVVDGKDVLEGEFVGPLDEDALAALCLEDGAGGGAVEAPEARGREVAMDLLLELVHGDAVEREFDGGIAGEGAEAGAAEDLGEREWVDVGS
jgi:hypothetical protein